MQSVETCCQSSGDELSVGVLPASPSERANCLQYVQISCREIERLAVDLIASFPAVGGGLSNVFFSRTAFLSVTLAHMMRTFALVARNNCVPKRDILYIQTLSEMRRGISCRAPFCCIGFTVCPR